jgi:hypothetical protein
MALWNAMIAALNLTVPGVFPGVLLGVFLGVFPGGFALRDTGVIARLFVSSRNGVLEDGV